MEEIPIPITDPVTPDRWGIGALNIRTSTGEEPAQGGGTIPANRVSISIVPQQWAGEVFVRTTTPIVVSDAAAYLAELAANNHPLAAAAAAKFAEVQGGLLWLTRLLLSEDGLCDPPSA